EHAVVLVVLGIIPFAESVTGFGVGTLVGIPLLMAIGLPPRRAAICGVLGLVIVPWGALGPGTLVAARLGGVSFQALGTTSALLSGICFAVMGAAGLWVGLGRSALRHGWFDLLIAVLALWLGVWLVNRWLGTALAGVLGSAAAIAVVLLHARGAASATRTAAWPWRDCRPYLLLVGGLLVTNLLPLRQLSAPLAAVIGSPACWLLVTAVATPALLRTGALPDRRTLTDSLRRWQPVAVATLLFLALGVVFAASGM